MTKVIQSCYIFFADVSRTSTCGPRQEARDIIGLGKAWARYFKENIKNCGDFDRTAVVRFLTWLGRE